MTVRVESVADPAAILDVLMPELEQEMFDIYGLPGQISQGDASYFVLPRGRLWVVYVDDVLAGMTGWTELSKLLGPNPFDVPTVEIKRVFVRKQFQGRDLTRTLERYVLADVFLHGYGLAVGETGQRQLASVAVHTSEPFAPVAPFGEYAYEEGSVFFGVFAAGWYHWLGRHLNGRDA